MADETLNKIAIFQKKQVRRVIFNNEWWFSVTDVIFALTNSIDSRDYWYKMKIRVKSEDGVQLSTFCRQLKLEASDGKKYLTDCANAEGTFRIIQSIPSPKAEPFKRWLAACGHKYYLGLSLRAIGPPAGGFRGAAIFVIDCFARTLAMTR